LPVFTFCFLQDTNHYIASRFSRMRITSIYSARVIFFRKPTLTRRCRAARDCRFWKVGDVHYDDETPSIRRMRVSSGDWVRSEVVGSLDIQKDPTTRNSLDRDMCKSTRSRNRLYRARLACDLLRACRSPPRPRRLMSERDARRTLARCRRDALHRNL